MSKMLNTGRHLAIATLLGASLGALTTPAVAQDALGAGDVLDANLNVNGTRNSAQLSNRVDYRARNLLVTGNVAGGRGFRGAVGYTAANDFRDLEGTVGSNDLFSFRADSAFSSISTINTGNTYNQLRFGQDLGIIEYRQSTSGANLSRVTTERSPYSIPTRVTIDDAVRVDRLTAENSFASRVERYADPKVVGAGQDVNGQFLYISASATRGIEAVPVTDGRYALGLNDYDMMRLKEDIDDGYDASRLGQTFDGSLVGFANEISALDTRLESSQLDDGRLDTIDSAERRESEYVSVLQRIRDRYAERDDVDVTVEDALLEEIDTDMQELIQQLRDEAADEPTDADADENLRETMPDALERIERLRGDDDTDEEDDEDGDERDLDDMSVADRARLIQALRHQEQVKSLSSAASTRFNELVQSAEDKLAKGEYFWAERRFVRALRFNPGEPLATAGMGHAQIGAGTYATASLTLRQLLINRPEMIDVMYDASLLPNRVAMNNAADKLDSRLVDNSDPASNGFLLAYIGHQNNDRAMITRGLDAMAAGDPESKLLPLLREIWLADENATK